MKADGYTHVAEGVGWGLRVISPGEPFTEGVEYSDEDITKAMVLLTDGENTFNSENNHNDSTYTAYGFLHQARLGSSNYWTAISAAELAAGSCLQQCEDCWYCELFIRLQRTKRHTAQPDQELCIGSGKVL